MKVRNKLIFLLFILFWIGNAIYADDGYDLWLKYQPINDPGRLQEYRQTIKMVVVPGQSETVQAIKRELKQGLSRLLNQEIVIADSVSRSGSLIIGTPDSCDLIAKLDFRAVLDSLGREGFMIQSIKKNDRKHLIITANTAVGLLYGIFHFLRQLQMQKSLHEINMIEKPKIQFRLLNHWDNLDGSVERGYAGKSLWKWDELPDKIDPRYRDYARANASLGINGTVLNNVNADPRILKAEYLTKVAKLADIFRAYGIRVYLSINFSSPISPVQSAHHRKKGIGNLATADPLNPEVRAWWKNKVAEIYQHIPDFGGFLVKANSEGMPGPQDYHRTHADGANMLAEALRPHAGIVMWRTFVYNADVDQDRAKRAYKEFKPLDGQFVPNVFLQAKNGPIDFQPREPVQPLFGALPKTPLMLELQITQEYLGHSTHLVYLAPMWQEYLQFDTFARGKGSTVRKIIDGSLHNYQMTGIAGVSNVGRDRNWCGHFFAQANWYAFGRLAWNHSLTAAQIAEEWIRLSISNHDKVITPIKKMLLGSWEACVNYMTPLGLHHIMQKHVHYGPGPEVDQGREDWTSVYYHRADSIGLGFNRSASGSNATSQYFSPLREQFDNIETCPEKYLLWFHHVNWDYQMQSGRTLWEELCHKYYSGTAYVEQMLDQWNRLQGTVDQALFLHVQNKLNQQQRDAVIWRDTCLGYFQQFSKKNIFRH